MISMIPIPKSRPRATRRLVMATAEEAWEKSHGSNPLPETFVLACRGYYSKTIGEPGNDISCYDDSFHIVTPTEMTGWNGNTDPSRYGLRPEGGRYMARLQTGCWQFKSLIHRGKYQAFGQGDSPVTVDRVQWDGAVARTETGEFGINLHRGGVNGTSSEGCCTLPPEQWVAFRMELNRVLGSSGLKRFAFILVDGPIS